MTIQDRITAFTHLGNYIRIIDQGVLQQLADQAKHENPWFTAEMVKLALTGIESMLTRESLETWTNHYALNPTAPKVVAIVMAGNIPLVGFHDLLSVLISGHVAKVKLSSKDAKLLPHLIEQLISIEPRFKSRISIEVAQLKNFEAVIATGSDNSSRYFEYYFGKYPNIIRKNRTSVAIISGNESAEELESLGNDIFTYFGLGCRNVSKLFVPHGYKFDTMIQSWYRHQTIIHHHKYCNNYDYQKSILLVNKIPFLDTGFAILQSSDKLVSPISVIYTEVYDDYESLRKIIKSNEAKIQCIVGKTELCKVKFGQAQFPTVWDYADQIDTLKFLDSI